LGTQKTRLAKVFLKGVNEDDEGGAVQNTIRRLLTNNQNSI